MKVKEFQIPGQLELLISSGVWTKKVLWSRINGPTRMAAATGNFDDPQWLDPIPNTSSMGVQIDAMLSLEATFLRQAYGMDRGAPDRAVDLPLADVNRFVPIMVSPTEFMVVLDYRTEPPRVAAPNLAESDGGFRWHVISADIGSFMAKLGV